MHFLYSINGQSEGQMRLTKVNDTKFEIIHTDLNGDKQKQSVKWHSHVEFTRKQEVGSSTTSPYNAKANQAHLHVKRGGDRS